MSDTTNGKPSDYYPLYDSLELKVKSDLVEIEEDSIIENNDTFKVCSFNNYTAPTGTFRQDSVFLFVTKDSIGQLYIYDSKGLIDMDKDTKWYATVTGAIDENLPNDVTLEKRLKIIKRMMFAEYLKTRLKLLKEVKLLNWSWETSDYSSDAHGEGKVVNNMDISISRLEYQIYYYDHHGNFMAEDNGNINKTLYPGEKYNFTFWSSNAKNPSEALLKLKFSDKNIFYTIKNQEYSGHEYEEYINQQ